MKRILLTLLVCMMTIFSSASETLHQSENYESGKLKYKITSVDNGSYYKLIYYYESGQVWTTGMYNGFGLRMSKWIKYYENGVTESITEYYSGMKSGDWYYYSEEGLLLFKVSWKNNKKHGEWLQYDYEGRLIIQKEYKRGKFIEGWTWSEDKGLVATYP